MFIPLSFNIINDYIKTEITFRFYVTIFSLSKMEVEYFPMKNQYFSILLYTINTNKSDTHNEIKYDSIKDCWVANLFSCFIFFARFNSIKLRSLYAFYHLDSISEASDTSERWEISSLPLYSCFNSLFEALSILVLWPIEEDSLHWNHSIT